MPNRRILLRHAFRPSTFSLVTVAGLNMGRLIGGTLIIEVIFALNGLGKYLVDGILRRDYIAVQGAVVVIAVGYVLINFLVDMLYAVLDPASAMPVPSPDAMDLRSTHPRERARVLRPPCSRPRPSSRPASATTTLPRSIPRTRVHRPARRKLGSASGSRPGGCSASSCWRPLAARSSPRTTPSSIVALILDDPNRASPRTRSTTDANHAHRHLRAPARHRQPRS